MQTARPVDPPHVLRVRFRATETKSGAGPRVSVHHVPAERLQAGGQSVSQSVSQCGAAVVIHSLSHGFLLQERPLKTSSSPPPGAVTPPGALSPPRSSVRPAAAPCVTSVPSVRRWSLVWSTGKRAAEAEKREAGETLETLTHSLTQSVSQTCAQ